MRRLWNWLLDRSDGQLFALYAAVSWSAAVLYAGLILWIEK